ncbi:ABC transporter substrate-binding protein [Terrihabitans soli]|uniref:ABC transporter substrate-binding protein n=1 Tax=Terrihabitans soli TaxID=708113 RepID=A0A6S6QT61_9HYPH|nr:hypothetical protein [Terrihabitans soli]BCJ90241.1 ABC transporter substrate-binding protein [Terrihabitans soli]
MNAAAGEGAGLSGFRTAVCCPKAVLIAGFLAALLSGCKTSGTTGSIETEAPVVAQSTTPNIIGTGPVAIAIFTDSGNSPQLAVDHRDGAALAVNQLAKDQITLTVFDAGANGADIGAEVGAAMTAGSKLLIGPPSLAATPGWLKASAGKKPPAILLAAAPAKPVPGSFWLVSSEPDSAAEVATYAVNSGKKAVLLASAAPLAPADLAQVKAAIELAGGTVLGPVTVPGAAIDRNLAAQADAVVLFGSLPSALLTPLREAGLRTDAWVLGTSEWKPGTYIEGGYFAAIDQNGFGQIAGRFQTAYGRKLSADAAYAFDAVAVVAGIVRAKGIENIAAAELKSATGFTGATGLFRFHNNGRVQRRFSIYKVEALSPKLHDAAPDGF